MAVGRRVPQEDRRERGVGQLRDFLLGLDLRLGVGGQRVERVALVEVELLALAVDRATAGEQETGDAGFLGEPGETDRGVAVDVEGELGVEVAHRVVGDRRQVHDGVAAVEVGRLDRPNVLDEVAVGRDHRLPVATLEQPDVAADDLGALLLKQIDQMGSDEALVTRDEYFHDISLNR